MIDTKNITILAIESSCDETAAAVVKCGREVLSSVIFSQIDIHQKFGGVVPEVASRNHTIKINDTVKQALEEANTDFNSVDAIAVTYGAGLSGALLVGVSYAKAICYALKKPLIAVNHIKGHIAANFITHKNLKPPFICLVVSGGHTALLEITSYTTHKCLGQTADDAVGEAFDKVSRVLKLGYPGGPIIDKLAKTGNCNIPFPKANLPDFNFSYSGLKTSVVNYVNKAEMKKQSLIIPDICASFQSAAMDILIEKSIKACKHYGYRKLCIAGGVSANTYLRENAQKACLDNNIKLFVPDFKYCTDNAAMIGAQGYYNFIQKDFTPAPLSLTAMPHLKL